MPITLDTSKFRNMLQAMAAARGKTEAEILNATMLKVLIGSGSGDGLVQLTPKTTKAKMDADMRHKNRANRIATQILVRSGFFKSGQKHTRAEINAKLSEVTRAVLNAKNLSRTYIATSWLNASFSLRGISGVTHRERRVKGTMQWSGGTAAKSFCVPATQGNLTVSATSYARGADVVSGPHVQQAFDNAAHDIELYFIQRMAKEVARAMRS